MSDHKKWFLVGEPDTCKCVNEGTSFSSIGDDCPDCDGWGFIESEGK